MDRLKSQSILLAKVYIYPKEIYHKIEMIAKCALVKYSYLEFNVNDILRNEICLFVFHAVFECITVWADRFSVGYS